MTIVGNTAEFAIDLRWDASLPDHVAIQVWLNGQPAGHPGAIISARSLSKNIKRFSEFNGQRHFSKSTELSAEQLMNELFDSHTITAAPGQRIEDAQKHPEAPDLSWEEQDRRAKIFSLGDVFDDVTRDRINIILVDEPERQVQRLVWRDLTTMLVHEILARPGTVDRVFAGALSAIGSHD